MEVNSGMRDDDSATGEVFSAIAGLNSGLTGLNHGVADCLSVRLDVVLGLKRCNSVSWDIDSVAERRISATVDANSGFHDPMFVANQSHKKTGNCVTVQFPVLLIMNNLKPYFFDI